jgi:hypothetical protein
MRPAHTAHTHRADASANFRRRFWLETWDIARCYDSVLYHSQPDDSKPAHSECASAESPLWARSLCVTGLSFGQAHLEPRSLGRGREGR